MAFILTELNIYPVKSLGGISVPTARLTRRGFEHDRRWMLVDDTGKFVSQRELPQMTQLATAFDGDRLVIHSKKNHADRLAVPLAPDPGEWQRIRPRVEVWSAKCTAWGAPPDVNAWFSDRFGRSLRLVYMPDSTRRPADGRYAPRGHYVGFADSMPFLLIGQAALDDLNARLAEPLPMNRFRPNLVFTGGEAYEDDEWGDFTIDSAPFRRVKPCGRCEITTTDQETGARAKEPLRTLATYRRRNNNVYFGQYAVWMGEGETWLKVGDGIEAK
jgi:uncharacterized protein YcbX